MIATTIKDSISLTFESIHSFSVEHDVVKHQKAVEVKVPKGHDDVILHSLFYLDPISLCKLRELSRRFKRCVDSKCSEQWLLHCQREFPHAALQTSENPKPLRTHYLHMRLKKYEIRLQNFEALKSLYLSAKKLIDAKGPKGLYGPLCEIVMFRNQSIANAVSWRRNKALSTFLLEKSEFIFDFRKVTKHIGPVNFLPLDSVLSNLNLLSAHQAVRENLSDISAPGFLGYVVDVAILKPEHEHLRHTILRTIYKNMSIWESRADAMDYLRTVEAGQIEAFYFCSVDYEPNEMYGNKPIISSWGFPDQIFELDLHRKVERLKSSLKLCDEI